MAARPEILSRFRAKMRELRIGAVFRKRRSPTDAGSTAPTLAGSSAARKCGFCATSKRLPRRWGGDRRSLQLNVGLFVTKSRTILDVWDITPEFLTKVVAENPSLRGMMLGYIAEAKLRELFVGDDRITAHRKDDDHDRNRKGDLVVTYKGAEFKFEAKALQTNSIRVFDDRQTEQPTAEMWLRKIVKLEKRYLENPTFTEFWEVRRLDAKYSGAVQCDASDKRSVPLPGGRTVQTTCLLVGEFDILAAAAFGFANSGILASR